MIDSVFAIGFGERLDSMSRGEDELRLGDATGDVGAKAAHL